MDICSGVLTIFEYIYDGNSVHIVGGISSKTENILFYKLDILFRDILALGLFSSVVSSNITNPFVVMLYVFKFRQVKNEKKN